MTNLTSAMEFQMKRFEKIWAEKGRAGHPWCAVADQILAIIGKDTKSRQEPNAGEEEK